MTAPNNEHDSGYVDSGELSTNRSKVILILLLALITFVSLGLNIKRYVGTSISDTVRNPTSNYTPLIAAFNASLPSSSTPGASNGRIGIGSQNSTV